MAYDYQLLLKRILEHPVEFASEKEIVYRDKLRYTYEDLNKRVQRLANALENLGVTGKDKVAVLDWDTHRFLECYFAIPSMGSTLHQVNVRYSEENLIYTMKHAKDDYVLVNPDFVPVMEKYRDDLESVKEYVLMGDKRTLEETDLAEIAYEDILNSASPSYEFPDLNENRRATLFYTTGTTGKPKGVQFTHRKIFLHTLGITSSFAQADEDRRISSEDVYMPLTPMFHAHAWGRPYVATLLGMKQVYPGKYDPDMLLKLIVEEGVTVTHMVPTILRMLLETPGIEKMDLSNLKAEIGGAKLPKGLAQKAKEKTGMRVFAGYGLSETCPVLAFSRLKGKMRNWDEENKLDRLVKTGFSLPLVDIKVVNEEGEEVKHDGEKKGEIVARAPWLAEEYYKDPERTEELWKGGWLHTGDVAVVDEEGYIQIVDRIDDLIKSGGEWIGSTTLEDLISTHGGVSDVAIIPVPDEKWGERPLAIIVPKEEGKVTDDSIKDHLMKYVEKGRIAKYAIPDKVEFVKEIPKTSVGKHDKRMLKDEYLKE